jgi:hypothetical protein
MPAKGFGSTGFSLCAFPNTQKSKSHRLKPVLLDRLGPFHWLHQWNGPAANTNSCKKFALVMMMFWGGFP